MGGRDLVVVGASAGGLAPLRALFAALPADFPATVLVVLHVSADGSDVLAQILDRAGPLPVRVATHGAPLTPSTVVLAGPDRHLQVVGDHVDLSQARPQNFHRPAIDLLFGSAARSAGPRTIGVVLSGSSDDGVAGLVAVQDAGGCTIVQDPADCRYPELPARAVEVVDPDHVVLAADLAALLDRMVRGLPTNLPAEHGGEHR